jgi:putative GTP pyrophosphokinase
MRGSPDRWTAQYRSEFESYETCATKLEGLICDLLRSEDIETVAVEARAKDPASLERKVESKEERYGTPLEDVTDLIGVRVIAYYLEDVEKINRIIEQEFEIDAENSSDKLAELEADRFGYLSVHYVVTLSPQRAKLGEWAVFADRKAEIQVRTATQHAWAAISHKLAYKRASEAPRKLRRKLTMLSAIFELADEQFSLVKRELEAVEEEYSADVQKGELDIPVDTASLEAFINASNLVSEIGQQFEQRGWGLGTPGSSEFSERYNRDLRDLAIVMESLEVETIAELDHLLQDLSRDSSSLEMIDSLGAADGVYRNWRSAADLLTVYVGVLKGVGAEVFESLYNPALVAAIRSLRGESGDPSSP